MLNLLRRYWRYIAQQMAYCQDKSGVMEKSEFSDRLGKIRKYYELSQQQMAEMLIIPFRTYQRMESGEGEKVNRHVLEIYAKNGVNLNWLFTGEGPMFIEQRTEKGALVGLVLTGANLDDVEQNMDAMRARMNHIENEFSDFKLRLKSLGIDIEPTREEKK
jgi:transcriptional regulator with XRE-family HTH domain